MRLTLITPVPAVTADLGADRTITGLALPYGVVGRTSAGPVTINAGALNIPTDLRRVKLFREHGRTTPVGYALTATSRRFGLEMGFRAAATPDGDTALLEASEGVRDALSVELDNVTLTAGVVTSADLTAVALVSIPAFADARLIAEDTPAPVVAPLVPAGGDEPDDDDPTPPPLTTAADADDETDDDDDDEETIPPTEGATVPATPAVPAVPAVAARTRVRGLSLDAAMARVVQRLAGSTDANAINAALTDIIPAADTSGGAFIKPQWLDELWTPINSQRPYTASINSGTLTGMKVYGWKWGTRPVVGVYAGNKAAVPSGPVTFLPTEAPAVRHAGGWDVDNVFMYLGDGSMLRAILDAAALDYAMKVEAAISAALLAGATAKTAADLLTGLNVAATTLSASGARPTFIAISPDQWAKYLGLTTANAPWWLNNSAGSVNLTDSTGVAADLRIFTDPTLPVKTILAGDRRAATHYEPAGNPFRVQAVNLPNGGVDIGVFGFSANIINDSRGLVAVTTTV